MRITARKDVTRKEFLFCFVLCFVMWSESILVGVGVFVYVSLKKLRMHLSKDKIEGSEFLRGIYWASSE